MASRRWFQFRLATVFVIVTIVACVLAFGPRARAYWNVRSLSNADVKVDGGYLGLMMEIHTPAADALRKQGPSANPVLLEALGNKDKFAAAHVLLTEINRTPRTLSAAEWNGMRVTLFADLRVDFHPEQAPQLAADWQSRLYPQRR
jgi:hypothetical protein